MSAKYTVDSKHLTQIISKAMSIIALGDKAESNSITLVFSKTGLMIEAANSAASFRSEAAVSIEKPAKFRAHIMPEILLSYANAYKELVLSPSEQSLIVKGGKNFSAELYFVGSNDDVKVVKPEGATNISSIATAASTALSTVGGIRNRTDQQVLGVMLEWGNKTLELTVGDTHHAVVIDQTIKQNSSGQIVMTLPNLQKIMSVGQNFASEENRFIAWSDTEYVSIMSQSENVFLANTARSAIKDSKRQTKVTLSTASFKGMIETLTNAVDETYPLTFKISKDKIFAHVKTGASSARATVKALKFAGKEGTVAVSIHHLKDCLSTMKDKNLTLSIFNNMVALESQSKLGKTIAAMASVATKE